MLVKQYYVGKSLYMPLTVQFEKIHQLLLTKNSINISNNVNVVLNTYKYKYLFLKLLLGYSMWLYSYDHGRRVSKTALKWKGYTTVLRNLHPSKPMRTPEIGGVSLQEELYGNVNKLAAARTKMEE